MRTNNGKVKNVIISLYFILIVLTIVLTTLLSEFRDLIDNKAIAYIIVLLTFAVLFFITHHVSKYFEYDSDGVQVVIINRGMLLSDYFNYREHKLEFEKEKLIKFKFNNYFFYKSLVVYVKGHNEHRKRVSFNVTLVSRKKIKYIKQSLSKMIKHNRKLNQANK